MSGIDPSDAVAQFARRMEFGQRLRNRRMQLSLTQGAVAAAAGWTSPVLLSAENGKSISPDVGAWIRIAVKLQLNPAQVLDWMWKARGAIEVAYLPDEKKRKQVIGEIVAAHPVADAAHAVLGAERATALEPSN